MITDNNIRLTDLAGKIRPAAVAGTFYPGDPAQLADAIRSYLDQSDRDLPPPKAIIAPHAGYIYSGPIAARAYAALHSNRKQISRVVLLGPAHRVYLEGAALPDAAAFATPLGNIAIDRELVRRVQRLPGVCIMDAAHAQEHSLEVHLPFLQSVLGEFTLLPLVIGDMQQEQVAALLESVWGGDETLIVISSDLSHYHDYETATRIDQQTSRHIKNFQLDEIGPQQACGCRPMRGLLKLARDKAMQIEVLDTRNSGDTAGPRDRVVGYGAYTLYDARPRPDDMDKTLLDMARQSIQYGFTANRPVLPDTADYAGVLTEKRATFVTIKLNGRLRGCIGSLTAIEPLIVSVADSAFKAAFKDPRFQPLSQEEFTDIEISISVLSTPAVIDFHSDAELLGQLQPGLDGLIIEGARHKATFLPEVWQSIAEPGEFLRQLKLKAGMPETDTPERAWKYQSTYIS